jgi:hypothetical protein
MTRVVITQPMYFPWPGFIAQLALADVVVWLDDVQFSKGSFTNRVQVRLPSGMSWLSIPLAQSGSSTTIANLAAAKPDWLDSHKTKLQQSLRGTQHYAAARSCVDAVSQCETLCDALIQSSQSLAAAFGIAPAKVLRSSAMGIDGHGSERVLRIVQAVGGTHYVTGHGAFQYLDHLAFAADGIEVDYMRYDVAPWGKAGQPFTPYVTALDLLAHVGPDQAFSHLNPKTTNWKDFQR